MLRDAPVVYDRGERIRDLLINEVRRRKELDPAAFAGTSWKLVPDSAALAARALFVRPGTPAAAPTTASAPVVLPAVAPANDTPELYVAPADETVATMKLPASAGPGGSLLRLMADAYRSIMRADLAIVAAPEGAQDLNSGDVNEQDLRAAVPGGEQLLKLSIRGDDLRWVFEHLVEGETPCCEISGATLTYAPAKPSLQRVRSVRFSSGRELEPKVTYQVVISRHLVDGESFILGGTKCVSSTGCATSGRTESLAGDRERSYRHRRPARVSPPSPPAGCSSGEPSPPACPLMPDTIRVYLNQRAVDLPAGTLVAEAIRLAEPQLSQSLESGKAKVTDGRGLDLPLDQTLTNGAILRIIVTSRRGDSPDDDALA